MRFARQGKADAFSYYGDDEVMRNKYPGPCYRCFEHVGVGEGHFELFRGRFRLQHATCAIKHRGTPDPERQADQIARDRRNATGTGRKAQRARRRLRDSEAVISQ